MSAAAKVLSATPTELELQVAQAFIDLEANSDLKAELRPLQFKSVKEIEVSGNKKAIVILVPVPLLSAYHKVQIRLTRELEKNSQINMLSSLLKEESYQNQLETQD